MKMNYVSMSKIVVLKPAQKDTLNGAKDMKKKGDAF